MKNLKKFISRFMWMFLACLIFSACSEDDDIIEQIEEGLPVSLKFELTTPAPNEIQTRATDEQETNVEKLALFFYKDEVSAPIVYEVPQAELKPTQGSSTTNYFYNISVPKDAKVTSGKWFLYAVANWDKGFWDSSITIDQLKTMNKTEMDNFCILKQYKTLDITETAILLSGKYGDTTGQVVLKAGPNTLDKSIHLKRSIAKITFNFSNGPGVTFTPRTYEIHNYCRTSTLFERDGFDGGDPGTLDWAGCAATSGEQIFSEGTGMPVDKGSIMFYMPENVQKAKTKIDDQLMREKKGLNGKFENAPENATYIVVHGDYVGPISQTDKTKVTASVHYTILLGDFSKPDSKTGAKGGNVNNYTTRRNTKYTYNVNVNGVKNIYVEATTKEELQPGAEGNIVKESTVLWPIVLDAHYETRILKISLDLVKKKGNYGVILKTPYSNYVTREIKEGELLKQDLDWVEFCKPATSKTWVKYPGTGHASLIKLPDLLKKFHSIDENKSKTYNKNFIVQKESDGKYYVYVQVFVNEYFYEGHALSEFINQKDRELTISSSTDISNDGYSTYTGDPIFAISQKSIKSPFTMTASNPFGLETFEDDKDAVVLNSSMNDSGDQNDMDNGHQNYFANFTDRKWSTYVDYDTNTLNSAYNYGVYQGLLRNRDLNGNGIIDDNEMKWFIPSVNQHIAIWNGFHALEKEVELDNGFLYYTSTNGQYRTMWANEGAFGQYKTTDYDGKELVRCIRALKDISAKTSRSTHYDAKTRIFSVTNFDFAAVRPSGSQKGEYLYHSQNDNANKLPEAFQMAKKDLSLGATLDNPGDNFVPEVAFVGAVPEIKGKPGDYKAVHNLTLKITNAGSHTFYTNTVESLEGATKIDNVNSFTGKVIGQGYSVWDGGQIQDVQVLYILADNGNYVKISNTKTKESGINTNYTFSVKNTSVVISKNQPVAGNPGYQSEFTLDEVTNQNICANYYENPDGSDKGQWRVPNQRELMVMLMFSTNGGMEGSDYSLTGGTATRTYYDGRTKEDGLFFLQASGKFITSEKNDAVYGKFKIRPVRDAQPQPAQQDQTSFGADSSYRPGGDVIK